MITLLDIQDADHFFSLVDHCISPVTIQLPDQQEVDIRHNTTMRRLLTCTSPNGSIGSITLAVNSAPDRDKMIRFMLENHSA